MRPPFTQVDSLGFGKHFTDHMFTMRYNEELGWYKGKISKLEPFALHPAASVFHYSQEIFEGLKAYLSEDEKVLLFRPEENARRMNRSARRLCMPEIPEELFLNALNELISLEKQWIPKAPGTSLYIRPAMMGVEAFLGVRSSKEYLFYIILSPVGPYFKEGFKPVGIYVEDQMARAIPGGVGDIKAGGNYAASLLAGHRAQELGYSQVLWLDAKEHRYLEEVGAMNVFVVFGSTLVTPPLTGSILPGITRDSVLKLAQSMGYKVEERLISIDQVLEGVAHGAVTEVFGSGTAAAISPVGSLFYKGKNYVIGNNRVGDITQAIYDRLTAIQYGKVKDEFGWVREINPK
ncbi:branched-chain amino acid aminotransferase [Desulfofalx alkaliphila]|uniref:branched-chain amino acid aminotransferase n=1 Tax=Desulfofalx alkaliphila TaxID=105483 RepID=UPI0005542C5A|nr:branched-chain amino acid aminotransferase [Desulfofalx alkaliphila]